jgi:hypothetical protein
LLKKIDWAICLIFFCCVSIFVIAAYVLQLLPLHDQISLPCPNYYLIFLGAMGLWLFFVGLKMVPDDRTTIIVAATCGALLASCGSLIGVAGAVGFDLTPLGTTIIYSFSGLYILLVAINSIILCVFSRHVVSDGMVILDSRIIRAGGRNKYWKCPFLCYRETSIKEKMDSVLPDLRLECRDGLFSLNCKATIFLGIGEMRATAFTHDKNLKERLAEAVNGCLADAIRECVQWKTLGSILVLGRVGYDGIGRIGMVDVCGLEFPIYWDGKFSQSNIKIGLGQTTFQ